MECRDEACLFRTTCHFLKGKSVGIWVESGGEALLTQGHFESGTQWVLDEQGPESIQLSQNG